MTTVSYSVEFSSIKALRTLLLHNVQKAPSAVVVNYLSAVCDIIDEKVYSIDILLIVCRTRVLVWLKVELVCAFLYARTKSVCLCKSTCILNK